MPGFFRHRIIREARGELSLSPPRRREKSATTLDRLPLARIGFYEDLSVHGTGILRARWLRLNGGALSFNFHRVKYRGTLN